MHAARHLEKTMTQDLPEMISDDEFAALLRQREQHVRSEHDRWDNTATNIRAPHKPTDGLPEATVEQQFPHIAQKLTLIWRSEAFGLYVKNLVVNDRDTRQGFPEEVVEDLMLLYEINEMRLRGVGLGQPATAKTFRSNYHPRRKI
jgi:hypothetical protein